MNCGSRGAPDRPILTWSAAPARCPPGAGFYQDHHFHYGYFVFAAAAVARLAPGAGAGFGARHGAVLALARDYASPSPLDAHFSQTRHKDWCVGGAACWV